MEVKKFEEAELTKIRGRKQNPIYKNLNQLQIGYKLIVDWNKDIVEFSKIYPKVYTRVLNPNISNHSKKSYIANIGQNMRKKGINISFRTSENYNIFEFYRIK